LDFAVSGLARPSAGFGGRRKGNLPVTVSVTPRSGRPSESDPVTVRSYAPVTVRFYIPVTVRSYAPVTVRFYIPVTVRSWTR
jgi:hypothetical protein